jgi:hypothetical protein
MARRRHTGEKQAKRQPLKLDKLPQTWLEWIQEGRVNCGLTWEELENASREGIGYTRGARKQLLPWAATPDAVKLFPQKTLPATTMHRWYDLRVEQVQKETMAQATRAREFAAAFASRGFKELPEAVMNALGDAVFALMEAQDESTRGAARRELASLGFLLAQQKKNEIAERRVKAQESEVQIKLDKARKEAEKATNDAAKKLAKGRDLTVDDINKIRERTFGLPPVQPAASRR